MASKQLATPLTPRQRSKLNSKNIFGQLHFHLCHIFQLITSSQALLAAIFFYQANIHTPNQILLGDIYSLINLITTLLQNHNHHSILDLATVMKNISSGISAKNPPNILNHPQIPYFHVSALSAANTPLHQYQKVIYQKHTTTSSSDICVL